jgi:hypothetical protein
VLRSSASVAGRSAIALRLIPDREVGRPIDPPMPTGPFPTIPIRI